MSGREIFPEAGGQAEKVAGLSTHNMKKKSLNKMKLRMVLPIDHNTVK